MISNAQFTGRDFWQGAVSMTPAAQTLHSISSINSPYAACPLELTIFVYCRNQAESIVQTLETVVEAIGVSANSFEIVVIDDNSHDLSSELVRGFMTSHEDVPIVMRINKQSKGLAQNYFDAAFMGCGSYYRMVLGDNSEPVETMVDIFKSIGDADIIVPYYVSRLKERKSVSFFARAFNAFINLISGNYISCYTASPMHLRYNVMRWHSDVLGAAFQMDLLCQLLAMDFTCKQVPCRAVSMRDSGGDARIKKMLSFLHATVNIIVRRMARMMY